MELISWVEKLPVLAGRGTILQLDELPEFGPEGPNSLDGRGTSE